MAIPRLLDPNTQPMDETNGMPSWLNPTPVTSPNEGFGAWASDSRNMAKIAPSLTPQPSAPGVDPQIPQTLFSNGEDLGMPKRVDLGLPSVNPPSLSQDMQNAPEAYGKPYLKNGQPSKWDRVAAALMGFSGGLRGNPSVGADYIRSLEQHDLNLPEQNQRTYNQRFIQPQLDALAVPAAKARVANTNAQTEHLNAETQAMVNPAAPLDKHLGGYQNDDGKQVEIFQNAATGKPYEVVMGNVNQKEANAQIQAENAWLARPENKGKDKADAAAWYATLTPQAKQQFSIQTTPASDADIEAAARALIDPRSLTALKDISSYRSDQRLKIFARAKELDPNFDPGVTNQRIRFLNQYEDPKGRASINRQAINNIMQHAADLSDINQQYRRSNVKVINTPLNAIARQFGDQVYTQFATTNSVLKDELALYFAGGYAPTQDQKKMWDKIQSDEAPPSSVEAFAKTVIHLAKRRADTFNSQFKTNMGFNDPNLITPEAMNAADRLGMGDEFKGFGSGGQISRQNQPETQNTPRPQTERPVYDKSGNLLGYTVDGKTFSRGAE